jgi:hypothetical protein
MEASNFGFLLYLLFIYKFRFQQWLLKEYILRTIHHLYKTKFLPIDWVSFQSMLIPSYLNIQVLYTSTYIIVFLIAYVTCVINWKYYTRFLADIPYMTRLNFYYLSFFFKNRQCGRCK